MVKILFCFECFKNLIKLGPICKITFEQVCEHYIYKDGFYEMADLMAFCDDDYVRILEQKGLVMSTECSEGDIIIIPMGLICISDDEYQICFENDVHANRFLT